MAGFPAKKNTALTFLLPGLTSQADTDIFQVNPTLATGDVKVSTGGASYANIGTLPSALDSGASLSVTLTADEMNGDYISIKFTDAAGDEWQDLGIMIIPDTLQMNGIVAGVLTTAMTEAYAADGAAATLAQGIYELLGFHNERNVGTFDDDGEATLTLKKRDGSTAAMTFTITGSTITRAS